MLTLSLSLSNIYSWSYALFLELYSTDFHVSNFPVCQASKHLPITVFSSLTTILTYLSVEIFIYIYVCVIVWVYVYHMCKGVCKEGIKISRSEHRGLC